MYAFIFGRWKPLIRRNRLKSRPPSFTHSLSEILVERADGRINQSLSFPMSLSSIIPAARSFLRGENNNIFQQPSKSEKNSEERKCSSGDNLFNCPFLSFFFEFRELKTLFPPSLNPFEERLEPSCSPRGRINETRFRWIHSLTQSLTRAVRAEIDQWSTTTKENSKTHLRQAMFLRLVAGHKTTFFWPYFYYLFVRPPVPSVHRVCAGGWINRKKSWSPFLPNDAHLSLLWLPQPAPLNQTL